MTTRFDAAQIKQWITDQTNLGPRRPGSPAGHRQEDDLVRALSSFGCESVRKEPIPVEHWEPGDCELQIVAPMQTAIACFPIPHAAFTSDQKPGAVLGRLVWADSAGWRLEDWQGAIVVAEIRFPMLDAGLLRRISFGEIDDADTLKDVKHPATWIRLGWHFYRRAISKGAAGFIGILSDQPGGTCRMYAPYGFREHDILDKPLPGAWVSRADGDQLKRLCESKAAVGRLRTTGTRRASVTHNVVAEIPGRSGETLILTCHHDSPFRSPVEDASGVGVVLAIAKHLAEAKILERRVIVLLTAGHFYGSIGTRTYISKHAREISDHTVFTLSVEHIAKEAVEDGAGRLVASGRPEAAGVFLSFNRVLRDLLLEVARGAGLDRWVLLPAEGPLGDYPPTDGGDWYAAGVPIVNYISNPVYLLTDDDADQWVDEKNLLPVAAAFTDLIHRLDSVPRRELQRCDFPIRRALMKVLRRLMQARTTRFGSRPVH